MAPGKQSLNIVQWPQKVAWSDVWKAGTSSVGPFICARDGWTRAFSTPRPGLFPSEVEVLPAHRRGFSFSFFTCPVSLAVVEVKRQFSFNLCPSWLRTQAQRRNPNAFGCGRGSWGIPGAELTHLPGVGLSVPSVCIGKVREENLLEHTLL